MDDSVGVETSVSEIVGSSSESMSEMGGIGEGPGMDRSVGDSSENSIIEGVGMKDSSISGDEGVSSKDGSVGDVGVSVVGDGARSVGVCSEGSLGLYDEGGRGTSSGPKSISKSISRWIGEGADEGIVGISEGAVILISSASGTLSLHLQSAVWKSVDTSEGQTGAVMYSVGAGVVHSGAVSNAVSATSDGHCGAVSYSVSQISAVS